MRHYCYQIVEKIMKGEKHWTLYVTANRSFSLQEMLAKQHWVLRHIDELPFNNITFKTASCRESIAVIKPVLPEPSTVAFHYDDITLDKLNREIIWGYDFVLEFVFHTEEHVQPFLEFLKKHWKGQWTASIDRGDENA